EEMREQVAAAHLLTLLQIAVERHRPSASLHESEDAALEAEVEARVQFVGLEPGIEHVGVAAPDLAEQEEVRTQLGARALAVLLPEGMVHVLDRVEPEAVDPRSLCPADLRVEKEFRHFRQLGLEVREPGETAG